MHVIFEVTIYFVRHIASILVTWRLSLLRMDKSNRIHQLYNSDGELDQSLWNLRLLLNKFRTHKLHCTTCQSLWITQAGLRELRGFHSQLFHGRWKQKACKISMRILLKVQILTTNMFLRQRQGITKPHMTEDYYMRTGILDDKNLNKGNQGQN